MWNLVQAEGAALLTGNARDFVPFARQKAGHAGLLLDPRVGDYRARYAIENDRLVVVVVKVGHRRN